MTFSESLSKTPDAESTELLCKAIADEFTVSMGQAERVAMHCARLREILTASRDGSGFVCLRDLLPLLRMRTGAIAAPLFALLEGELQRTHDPWPLLAGLLSAKDRVLAQRALDLMLPLVQRGTITIGIRELSFLAGRAAEEGSPLADAEALVKIREFVNRLSLDKKRSQTHPALFLFTEQKDHSLRRLAARILDFDNVPVSPELVGHFLSAEDARFLAPYLAYTRATHVDLLSLLGARASVNHMIQSLRTAEALCGDVLLRTVIAELGWSRVNLGCDVRRYVGISISGSLPLHVTPHEATLFESHEEVHRTSDCHVVVAQGGQAGEEPDSSETADSVAHFRAYNEVHAELLDEILNLSPLSPERIHIILCGMDIIVGQFCRLFNAYSDECTVLPAKYRELKEKILTDLELVGERPEINAELMRLVQMFEDPGSLDEVHTLHGLKRYLHQTGLKLGFRLVSLSRNPNRTVDIVLIDSGNAVHTVKKIRYADFDPGETGDHKIAETMPYSVSVVVAGFVRQLLHGQETFPTVDIFCYGNEVHYYLAFRNHPALVRIDYSPPLRGGMIDLEYYGVSNYEMSVHPNIDLDAIRIFFEKTEFEIAIRGARIHARIDKERVLDLQTLCEKAETLFCLAPYLMDVDWVIGSLNLSGDARRKVAEAWAESFILWGVLPVEQLLTSDRLGILERVEVGPTGDREIAWPGEGKYRDRFSYSSSGFFTKINSTLEALGIDTQPLLAEDSLRPMGQLRLERCLFNPLREALARGELVESLTGIERVSPDLFQPEHEVERFARILNGGAQLVADAMTIARLITPHERTLSFRTTGSINGHDIECAQLPLRGEKLAVYVLRDKKDMITLALFAMGPVLCRNRISPSDEWRSNASCDIRKLASILRRHNYTASGPAESPENVLVQAQRILDQFREKRSRPRAKPFSNPNVIYGLKAAPGRAVGTAILGTSNRNPQELEDTVLISSVVRPEDNTILYHTAGVVSTGGGVLSHAGLLAAQFHKPALVISARWRRELDGSPTLLYLVHEYTEEKLEIHGWDAIVRKDFREREHLLWEQDLVVLDADEGTLSVLGQDHDALALHDAFRELRRTSRLLSSVAGEKEMLALRGRRLRARHLTEKVLRRLREPMLAWYAVHELLLGQSPGDEGEGRDDRAMLLRILMDNRQVGRVAQDGLHQIVHRLEDRCRELAVKAHARIPDMVCLHELLATRLELFRRHEELMGAVMCLREGGIECHNLEELPIAASDEMVLRQIEQLCSDHRGILQDGAARDPRDNCLRHILRQLERESLVLGIEPHDEVTVRLHHDLESVDRESHDRLYERRVIGMEDCGMAQSPFIGWKAANLGELAQIAGADMVPPWFVVTNKAFQEMMQQPFRSGNSTARKGEENHPTLHQTIDAVLRRTDLSHAEMSAHIRGLWAAAALPERLVHEVLTAYHQIIRSTVDSAAEDSSAAAPQVALRSSSCEEDTETAARAGEFETYLFISRDDQVLDYLKRTWSGLWTERAIHNRLVLGTDWREGGGGVMVQKMIRSRVSGVLQTINVASGELGEMVINAGLGIGEGVVSGVVDADHITVAKEGNLEQGNLRFRYVTNDKKKQVIFNRQAGYGTVLTDTLNHQRLRPALEYTELCDLVRIADRMEKIYGYPLDIEFALEGIHLWILQVRPVTTFLSVLRATLERYPLTRSRSAVPSHSLGRRYD